MEEMTEWERVIDEALICNWIGTSSSFETPQKALAALIQWEIQIALDPAVSSSAQALLDKGFEAGWRTAVEWSGRDDLFADIDSPAYIKDREIAFGQIHEDTNDFPFIS